MRRFKSDRISCLVQIDNTDSNIVLTGSNGGFARVYKTNINESATELITAWKCLPDMLPDDSGSGLIIEWDQTNGKLYAAGDSKYVKIWDINTEKCVQVL